MKHFSLIFLFTAGLLTPLAQATPTEDAVAAYASGDFAAAAHNFQTALTTHPSSPDLFYNLAMSLKKEGDAGQAALNFRRALLLAPRMADARAGLSDLERAKGIPPGTADWRTRLFEHLPISTALVAGFAVFWLGAFGALWAMMRSSTGGIWTGTALALLGILAFSIGYLSDPRFIWRDGAVVVAAGGAALLSAPADSSEALANLPAGFPVHLEKKRGEWSYVALENGAHGWMPASALAALVPAS